MDTILKYIMVPCFWSEESLFILLIVFVNKLAWSLVSLNQCDLCTLHLTKLLLLGSKYCKGEQKLLILWSLALTKTDIIVLMDLNSFFFPATSLPAVILTSSLKDSSHTAITVYSYRKTTQNMLLCSTVHCSHFARSSCILRQWNELFQGFRKCC